LSTRSSPRSNASGGCRCRALPMTMLRARRSLCSASPPRCEILAHTA
jgi:hypothetical protein